MFFQGSSELVLLPSVVLSVEFAQLDVNAGLGTIVLVLNGSSLSSSPVPVHNLDKGATSLACLKLDVALQVASPSGWSLFQAKYNIANLFREQSLQLLNILQRIVVQSEAPTFNFWSTILRNPWFDFGHTKKRSGKKQVWSYEKA